MNIGDMPLFVMLTTEIQVTIFALVLLLGQRFCDWRDIWYIITTATSRALGTLTRIPITSDTAVRYGRNDRTGPIATAGRMGTMATALMTAPVRILPTAVMIVT